MVRLKRFRFNSQRLSILLLLLLVIKNLALPLVSLAEQPAWNVELVGKLAGGLSRDVFVKGDYAYVAAEGILSIIDVSNPRSPKAVGYYHTPGGAEDVYVLGGYIYVADFGSGLWILNFTKEVPLTITILFFLLLGLSLGYYLYTKFRHKHRSTLSDIDNANSSPCLETRDVVEFVN